MFPEGMTAAVAAVNEQLADIALVSADVEGVRTQLTALAESVDTSEITQVADGGFGASHLGPVLATHHAKARAVVMTALTEMVDALDGYAEILQKVRADLADTDDSAADGFRQLQVAAEDVRQTSLHYGQVPTGADPARGEG